MRDWILLRRYVEKGSEEAFAALVERHLSLVYTTCLREVHDAELAEDLTQIVFLILVQKAPTLREKTLLAGWLFHTARFASRNALRRERRRRIAEQKALNEMRNSEEVLTLLSESIEPHLNKALTTLTPKDREAVLLRFFEGRSMRETSIALGITEGAAQMRVSRAIEKLRRYFSRRGITISAAALLGLLLSRTSQAVPPDCRASTLQIVSNAAGKQPVSSAASPSTHLARGVLRAMWISKIQVPAALTGVLLLGLGGHSVRLSRHADGESRPVAPPVPITTAAFTDDPRLSQKVKISAEGISVGELLTRLAKKTGVFLEADGVTADDKIMVFNPARPLRDVMEDVAVLFHDTWRHTTEGTRHYYRLSRNVRVREYEEALANQTSRGLLAHMDAQVKALGEPAAQRAKRPENDPIRQALESPQGRTATGIYALLSLEQRRQLMDEWQIRLPVTALSANQKTEVEELFHGKRFDDLNSSDPNIVSGAATPIEQIPRDQMDQHELTFILLRGTGTNSFLAITMSGPKGFEMSVTNFPTAARFLFPKHGSPYEAKPAPAETPFEAKAVTAVEGTKWPDRLKALSEKTGLPIFADYYRSKPIFKSVEEPETSASPALNAMDAFCQSEGYLWWSRGTTLLFRKRDWYNQRLYETPDSLILKLSEQVKGRNGILTAADVLMLQNLTLDQMAGLNESMGVASDRRLLAGLHKLLAAVAACPGDKNAPLYVGSIGDKVMPDEIAIKPDFSNPHQQALTAAFLNAFWRKVAPKDIIPGTFGFILVPAGPDPNVPLDVKAVSVDIMLSEGDRGMGIGYHQVVLPLGLPDDRRDKTKIEVVP